MPAEILQSSLAIVALAPAANIVVPHGLRNRGPSLVTGSQGLVPNIVLPDRASGIVVTAVDAINVTFNNPTPAAETANFLVQFDHTIQAANAAPIAHYWQGAVGAGGGEFTLGFQRTIVQPADGSDFVVLLPVAFPDDTYVIMESLVDVVGQVTMSMPDALPGDRTALQFRVITSAALINGDVIEFLVRNR